MPDNLLPYFDTIQRITFLRLSTQYITVLNQKSTWIQYEHSCNFFNSMGSYACEYAVEARWLIATVTKLWGLVLQCTSGSDFSHSDSVLNLSILQCGTQNIPNIRTYSGGTETCFKAMHSFLTNVAAQLGPLSLDQDSDHRKPSWGKMPAASCFNFESTSGISSVQQCNHVQPWLETACLLRKSVRFGPGLEFSK